MRIGTRTSCACFAFVQACGRSAVAAVPSYGGGGVPADDTGAAGEFKAGVSSTAARAGVATLPLLQEAIPG